MRFDPAHAPKTGEWMAAGLRLLQTLGRWSFCQKPGGLHFGFGAGPLLSMAVGVAVVLVAIRAGAVEAQAVLNQAVPVSQAVPEQAVPVSQAVPVAQFLGKYCLECHDARLHKGDREFETFGFPLKTEADLSLIHISEPTRPY